MVKNSIYSEVNLERSDSMGISPDAHKSSVCANLFYFMFASKLSTEQMLDQEYNKSDLKRFPKLNKL